MSATESPFQKAARNYRDGAAMSRENAAGYRSDGDEDAAQEAERRAELWEFRAELELIAERMSKEFDDVSHDIAA